MSRLGQIRSPRGGVVRCQQIVWPLGVEIGTGQGRGKVFFVSCRRSTTLILERRGLARRRGPAGQTQKSLGSQVSNPVYAALTSSLVSRFNHTSEVQIEDNRKLRDRYIAASLNRKTIAGQALPRLRSDCVSACQKTAVASCSLHAMEKSRVHRRYEVTIVEACTSSCTLAISRQRRVRALKLAVLLVLSL